MPRYAYVNGLYLHHHDASIPIEDRGFQFADGIYEVISCIHGKMADEQAHLDRLRRSLDEIGMDMPVSETCLKHIIHELLRKNRMTNAIVYIQVTRGTAKRDFPFPDAEQPQSLVLTARPFEFDHNPKHSTGIRAITVPDIRWKRRDIKSIALLPQVLAKQKAVEAGAGEAFMVDDAGYVTEGASSNAWMVTKTGTLVTRAATCDILRGVTRMAIAALQDDLALRLEERAFTPEEAYQAAELFTSSASALIMPVVELDGHKIGTGKPGPVVNALQKAYRDYLDGRYGKPVRWQA